MIEFSLDGDDDDDYEDYDDDDDDDDDVDDVSSKLISSNLDRYLHIRSLDTSKYLRSVTLLYLHKLCPHALIS